MISVVGHPVNPDSRYTKRFWKFFRRLFSAFSTAISFFFLTSIRCGFILK